MVRWSTSVDLEFPESAHLAFARAAELAETDVHEQYAGAWAIEDRRISLSLSLEIETGRTTIEAMQRFLALQAIAGEATIEIAFPPERWARRPASLSSSKEIVIFDGFGSDKDDGPASKTIRAATS